jgi:hypothetical protein
MGFHLIASTKPLGKVSIGDRLLFLFARVRSGQGVCDEEVRGRGDNILQSFVSTGRKFSTGSDVLITQSIYSRVMVVGRQYGTDQNDGMIFISQPRHSHSYESFIKQTGDPRYAFYHVFKSADYRVEQLQEVSVGIKGEFFFLNP